MLPRAAYTDPAMFAWEQRHFFASGWTCAGRSDQLGVPGDQRAESTGESTVLLVRGEDHALRAFANTCRHRGHELLPCGAGLRRQVVVCPYHSWTYSLDGRLRAAAHFDNQPGFVRDEWGLRQLPLTEWHGLLFVDASGTAPPLEDSLGGLEDLVAPYEMSRLVVAAEHHYEARANWKILSENYHECYHCPTIHPELCRVSPPRSGKNYTTAGGWLGGSMELRDGAATMSLDGRSGGEMLRGLSLEQRRSVIYIQIFPNVLVSLHPDYVMVHRLIPLAVDETRIECTWAFAPETVEGGADPAYAVEFWDITNRQDWHACEAVQRGLSSAHAVPGPLSPEEDAVYRFVTMVARGYLGQPVSNPGAVEWDDGAAQERAGAPG
jgi:Rieske 2Fe-2S family protein